MAIKEEKGICGICSAGCWIIAEFDDQGRIVKLLPDEGSPMGITCKLAEHVSDIVYSEDRLLYPQRRKGPKGTLEFERITWQEAYDEIAARLNAQKEKYGPEAAAIYTGVGTFELAQCDVFQPKGVHGPSEVVDQNAFGWEDGGWGNIPLEDYVFYELHVGTFTPEGTFEAAIEHIPYLRDLGVTAVELMPVSQFPGTRNWGYDCVYPFSVHEGYGGPEGLKRLVNAFHKEGLAVVLDVVYNHLGPEGNYLGSFGPYFTDRYQTPWGDAINFDGEGSGQVRDFFISNAQFWAHHFHIDALRLDAVHGIFDQSPEHILKELNESIRESTDMYLIAESDLNDPRVIEDTGVIDDTGAGGYGLDLQWNDDFHHALHTLLTSEDMGYYMDFGDTSHLAKALKEGFIYSGQFSAFRKQHHGRPTAHLDPCRFVVFSQ
ncbi:hypothetical protein LCGC14_2585020, partial [marine sediment metagenome]